MRANLIDGKAVSNSVRDQIKVQINQITDHLKPGLAVVKVGNNPASEVYVKHKIKACVEVGITSFSHELPADTSRNELLTLIRKLNDDNSVHGILVQLPLPEHLDSQTVIDSIAPEKDVDGFHPINMGRLAVNQPGLRPCTPRGIIKLLDSIPDYDLMGKHAVVVGSSNIVGRPVSLELLARKATVTICHSKTNRLEDHVKNADILVVAVGIPAFIPGSWIKPYAVVIDVGINRLEKGGLCGDVFFAEAKDIASHITPVPGGVGPMTIACLLENTLKAYQLCQK